MKGRQGQENLDRLTLCTASSPSMVGEAVYRLPHTEDEQKRSAKFVIALFLLVYNSC